MKRTRQLLSIFLIAFSQILMAQEIDLSDFTFPDYVGYVNDFEGLFTPDQVLELEKMISLHEEETSNEIAIVTIKSYDPYTTLFDYSLRLAEQWGIGKKDKNNGIAIVFGKQIREIRIQVGYGLEDKLKDEEAKSIIDNIIIPEFKNGNYFLGIKNGLQAIIIEIG